MRTSFRLFLLTALSITFTFSFAQEYDDMYFNKNDRKQLKSVEKKVEPDDVVIEKKTDEVSESGNKSFLGRMYDYQPVEESDNSNGISQEAIDRYKTSSIDDYTTDEVNVPRVDGRYDENPNFSDPVETYQEPIVINNYYGNNNWSDRFRPGWGAGSRWNNWGWRSNLWVSFGWGNSWYDPFWDPVFFDPFWGPYNSFAWGWGRPNFGWNRWGWNRGFAGGFYDPFWCPPGYYGVAGGYYRGVYRGAVVARNERVGRAVTRGPRSSRGGTQPTRSSRRVDNVAVSNSVDGRDFSRNQSRYLERSRNSVRVTNGRSSSTGDIRSRNAEAARNIRSVQGGRNSNSLSDRTPRSSDISNPSRSARSTNVERSRNVSSPNRNTESVNTRRSRNVSSPSRNTRSNNSVRSGSSRSFSSPARSSSSVRSSRPSRSFSTPSRSSGSVRSSSPSRSSGSRSSGRSSSSRSKSSSRSRGN